MRLLSIGIPAVMALALTAGMIPADTPDDAAKSNGGPACHAGPGSGECHTGACPHASLPLMTALDANQDGKLSAGEIENAAARLQELDTDGDGCVTADELRPQGSMPCGKAGVAGGPACHGHKASGSRYRNAQGGPRGPACHGRGAAMGRCGRMHGGPGGGACHHQEATGSPDEERPQTAAKTDA